MCTTLTSQCSLLSTCGALLSIWTLQYIYFFLIELEFTYVEGIIEHETALHIFNITFFPPSV